MNPTRRLVDRQLVESGVALARALYPAAESFAATPVMLRGMAAKPETWSIGLCTSGPRFSGFTWYGLRPDCKAERVGEQYLAHHGDPTTSYTALGEPA